MTTDLTLRTHYWDDPKARAAFKEFIFRIHGLDFTAWEAAGFWDDAYTPFSFFKGKTVVASVCIYLLDFVIDGQRTRLAQVSGVGTLSEWRRKGLNRQLTDIGLKWAQGRHDGVFLFSDEGAVPFYKRCGFFPMQEYVEWVPVTPPRHCGGAIRLDPGDKHDRDKISAYAKRRTPVSNTFGVLNDKLLMFHVLYSLRNDIHEIPDLNCLVFCRRTKEGLSIYDIVGERVPRWEEIYPHIADPTDSVIEFHFCTDRLGLQMTTTRQLEGNFPFVRGTFPIAKPVFPFTSRA